MHNPVAAPPEVSHARPLPKEERAENVGAPPRQPGAGALRRRKNLVRRYRKEWMFRGAGVMAIALALVMLAVLLGTIAGKAASGLTQTYIRLPVRFDAAVIDPEGTGREEVWQQARFQKLADAALEAHFPDAADAGGQRLLRGLLSNGARDDIKEAFLDAPELLGREAELWLLASDDVDMVMKGISPDGRQGDRLEQLRREGRVERQFNLPFFTHADSREPEKAGILGGLVGSLLTIAACLLVSFPLAVMTAVYLQEFAPKNRWTDLIEINTNNLAAVPSIIFGLLGLSVYLHLFGMPRSASLVGGMTLALMILPTIIISTRTALRSVPQSIRDAALALGATPMQAVTHHVLPLAMPGIMTGTILGVARALGETAPLLMVGMMAFVAAVPGGWLEPATVMPVQVYLWADSPEPAFAERTSLAILCLLVLLVVLNAAAVMIRKKFERRW